MYEPKKFKASYSARYDADTPTVSMRKLGPVAMAAETTGFVNLVEPNVPGIKDRLRQLHDPEYVDAFIAGRAPLAESQGWRWTPEIRDGVLAIQEGQLAAAAIALKEGLAANVAQGFHHATYECGGGFCTFNGLALVAQEYPDRIIFVLDCDEHAGDGTENFVNRLGNLHQSTIHGASYGCSTIERSACFSFREPVTHNWTAYESALLRSFELIKDCGADLVIYQAGADPHINDPLGSLGMTTEQMEKRDRMVFKFLLREEIPTLFVLAGGYQEPIREKLVPLHLNTFAAASSEYNLPKHQGNGGRRG